MKVSFLGLGVMGYPMAGYLVKAGHEVCVYNRTAEKAAKWVQQHGGTLDVKSVAGEGTTFMFTLPYTQPIQDADNNDSSIMSMLESDD